MHAQSFDSDTLAEKYSQLNGDVQLGIGNDLFISLNTKHGEDLRVLDMGCGTGELTAFIADALGKNSEVVGVDPDLNRINIAINKNSRENLTFIHGESSSRFPHYNEAYYDLHFSNLVVNWLNPSEKELFLNTAFRVLKPGGRIALQSLGTPNETFAAAFDLLLSGEIGNKQPVATFYLNKWELGCMIKQTGFEILTNEDKPVPFHFKSLDRYLNWIRASSYFSESKLCKNKMESFVQRFVNDNGSITYNEDAVYQIIAIKPQ